MQRFSEFGNLLSIFFKRVMFTRATPEPLYIFTPSVLHPKFHVLFSIFCRFLRNSLCSVKSLLTTSTKENAEHEKFKKVDDGNEGGY